MINRRSTPSGDGRGRGRAGGSGRGGRPAFRSGDARGGSRGDAFRDDSRGGPRRDDSRGGPRRDDSRDSRDSGGFRDSRSRDSRDFRGSGPRDSRDSRDSRGGFRDSRGSRDDVRSDSFRSDSFRADSRTGSRAGERGGSRFAARDDARDALRADRSGSRARYGRSPGREDRVQGRVQERGYDRDRAGGGRGDGYRPERSPSGDGGYDRPGRFDRPGRDDRRGRDDRSDRFRRDDRSGRDDRSERFNRDDRSERPGRDDRSGRFERPSREGGGQERGALRAGRGGRPEQGGRGQAAPTAASSRSRYGRGDDDARGPRASRRDGAPRRDGFQTIGDSARRPAERQPANRFKTARQPVRDRDFYPEGYTDERDTTEVPGGVRLQKVLAQAGVASRRACEEMIGDGRVTVNGQVVRRFGAKVDPATQIIHVDGKRIPTAPDLVYYALNKPIGVVSTMDDPQGRPCLADYVQELAPRLFHVGRLDTETEGLLLLTNDGELANRLTHPSYGVQKKYWAKVPGPIPRDLGRRLKQGIELEDGIARADSFAIVQEHAQQALVEVVLHEGRKHVVRRMLEEAGHRVIDLARIEFGPVKLGRTKPGTVRALTLKEVGDLYAAVKL